MLRLLLVDTLPILFRFLPKCLERSLVIARKQKKNKQELVKILLENVLAYQVAKFISILCCLIIPTI